VLRAYRLKPSRLARCSDQGRRRVPGGDACLDAGTESSELPVDPGAFAISGIEGPRLLVTTAHLMSLCHPIARHCLNCTE
jgi:hypothetical protein